MAFTRHKNLNLRAVFALLHLLLAIYALTAVCSAFAQEQEAQANDAAAPADQRKLDIWEFRVEGNTLLTAASIETAVSPFLGPGRAVSDIDTAANNLERLFRDSGFPAIYVSVPEQNVQEGVVRLQVVEGKIERVRVQGSRYFSINDIREKLPSLQSGNALHVPTMQQELTALNGQSGDMKVTPILKAGKTPGSVDIDLRVKDDLPLHGSVELNNYNSANTTNTRLATSISYDNLWQAQHSFSLQWQVAPEKSDESNVLGATYVMPWFDSGNRLAVYAVTSNSDVASVGDINVVGDGNIYGVRYVMPMPSDRQYVHSLSVGADYKDYKEIIRLDPTNKLKTPIDYAVWSVQYNAIQFKADSQTQWTASANFGIRGVGNSDSEFIDKRNHASANFAYLRGSMVRTDDLPKDWLLVSSLHAQWSDSALINNEQFSAGGESSVRGYYESQSLGDSGAALGLEIKTPNFMRADQSAFNLRALSFLEGARLHINDAQPEQQNTINLASAGLGLELQAWDSLNVSLDWAHLLKANGDLERGDDRLHLGARWKF